MNAVCHKDYSRGVPIQISVYRDKIMLWNPGQLPADWTVERLMQKHASQPFNPDIANVFFRAGMIEAWGRGIERIIDACQSAGVPTSVLRYDHTCLWVEFAFPELMGEQAGVVTQETTQETAKKTTQERILALIEAQPTITGRELAKKVGISSGGIKYHLNKLKSAGIIRHEGSTKAGQWKILK